MLNRMQLCSLAGLLLAGCNGMSGGGVGADWDGSASATKDMVFVASYSSSTHLKSVSFSAAAGTSANDVAAMHESTWDADGIMASHRPSSDTSVVCFPDNVTDMVIISEGTSGGTESFTLTSAPVTLPNGMTIRKRTGSPCN